MSVSMHCICLLSYVTPVLFDLIRLPVHCCVEKSVGCVCVVAHRQRRDAQNRHKWACLSLRLLLSDNIEICKHILSGIQFYIFNQSECTTPSSLEHDSMSQFLYVELSRGFNPKSERQFSLNLGSSITLTLWGNPLRLVQECLFSHPVWWNSSKTSSKAKSDMLTRVARIWELYTLETTQRRYWLHGKPIWLHTSMANQDFLPRCHMTRQGRFKSCREEVFISVKDCAETLEADTHKHTVSHFIGINKLWTQVLYLKWIYTSLLRCVVVPLGMPAAQDLIDFSELYLNRRTCFSPSYSLFMRHHAFILSFFHSKLKLAVLVNSWKGGDFSNIHLHLI